MFGEPQPRSSLSRTGGDPRDSHASRRCRNAFAGGEPDMKKASYAFAFLILFATCGLTYSQSRANGPTGTWRVEGDGTRFRWEAVLRADGPNLIGAVSSCNSITRAFEIFEGEVNGDTITFKCRSLDGQRTVTLNGRVEGDEIDFTWELQVQDGGNPGANDEMFGVSAPRRFTAKRVPDATDVVAEAAAHVLGPSRSSGFCTPIGSLKTGSRTPARYSAGATAASPRSHRRM
jgi:hypothetical protein